MPEAPVEIDWEKELGPENRGQYNYTLPSNDPEIAGNFVFDVLLSILTSDRYFQKQVNDFVQGSENTIPDEKTEEDVRDLLNRDRASMGIFAKAIERAASAQRMAKEAVADRRDFLICIDYPDALPIKGSIGLHPAPDYPDFVIACTQLARVKQRVGFPDIILERYAEKSSGIDLRDIAERTAALSGNTFSKVIQSMFDRKTPNVFLDAMDSVGRYSKFDPVKAAFISSGRKNNGRFPLAETFSRFTEEERQVVQRPKEQSFWFELDHTIEVEEGSGRFHTDYYIGGYLWYDPKLDSIVGKVSPDNKDHINAYVTSVITPATTHEGLLKVRRKAQDMVKGLGFPEPSRILYW